MRLEQNAVPDLPRGRSRLRPLRFSLRTTLLVTFGWALLLGCVLVPLNTYWRNRRIAHELAGLSIRPGCFDLLKTADGAFLPGYCVCRPGPGRPGRFLPFRTAPIPSAVLADAVGPSIGLYPGGRKWPAVNDGVFAGADTRNVTEEEWDTVKFDWMLEEIDPPAWYFPPDTPRSAVWEALRHEDADVRHGASVLLHGYYCRPFDKSDVADLLDYMETCLEAARDTEGEEPFGWNDRITAPVDFHQVAAIVLWLARSEPAPGSAPAYAKVADWRKWIQDARKSLSL